MLPFAQHLKPKPVTTTAKLEEWGMLIFPSLLHLYKVSASLPADYLWCENSLVIRYSFCLTVS